MHIPSLLFAGSGRQAHQQQAWPGSVVFPASTQEKLASIRSGDSFHRSADPLKYAKQLRFAASPTDNKDFNPQQIEPPDTLEPVEKALFEFFRDNPGTTNEALQEHLKTNQAAVEQYSEERQIHPSQRLFWLPTLLNNRLATARHTHRVEVNTSSGAAKYTLDTIENITARAKQAQANFPFPGKKTSLL